MFSSNTKNGKKFWVACRDGDINTVRSTLASITTKELNDKYDPNTPLYQACLNGHFEIVKLLLTRQDIEFNKGQVKLMTVTPLHGAASNGHANIVRLLLSLPGINVNKSSPLGGAAQEGRIEVLKLLLARPDLEPNYGLIPPLYGACAGNQVEAVRLLLGHPGLDVNKGILTCTPLSGACEKKNIAMIALILNHPNCYVSPQDEGKYSSLLARARRELSTNPRAYDFRAAPSPVPTRSAPAASSSSSAAPIRAASPAGSPAQSRPAPAPAAAAAPRPAFQAASHRLSASASVPTTQPTHSYGMDTFLLQLQRSGYPLGNYDEALRSALSFKITECEDVTFLNELPYENDAKRAHAHAMIKFINKSRNDLTLGEFFGRDHTVFSRKCRSQERDAIGYSQIFFMVFEPFKARIAAELRRLPAKSASAPISLSSPQVPVQSSLGVAPAASSSVKPVSTPAPAPAPQSVSKVSSLPQSVSALSVVPQPQTQPVESLSTESLVDLLRKVGFSDQTCGAFADQQIDGNIVGTMTEEMIAEEMEIQEIKERKRLLYFFQRIVKEGLDWTSDSIGTHRSSSSSSSSSAGDQTPSVDKILSHNDDLFGEIIQWDPDQVGQWILSTPSIASIQPAFSQLGISGLVLLMLTEKDIDTFKTLKIGERQKLKEALREIKSTNRRKGRQESRLNDVDLLGSFSVKEFLHGFNPSVSCVASLRANINALNFPGLGELVTRIEAHAREKAPTKKPPGLSDDEFFALIAYTFENKGGVNIYQRLSQCLRSHNPIQIKNNTISEELKGWKVLLFYLISALLKLPKVAKNCFRGMTIADPSFMETIKSNYSVGRQIEWFGFSSTSTNKDVSMGFIIGQGILFCIKTLKGKDLRMFSVYAQEEEVLMLPNSKFFVASPATRHPQNPNIWIIEMVEVDDQVPFFG